MKRFLLASALSLLSTVAVAQDIGPRFWLVELGALGAGKYPHAVVVNDYETAEECHLATYQRELPEGAFFTACVPLDEEAEASLADHIDNVFPGSEGAAKVGPRESFGLMGDH